ncbi:MAG: DEAD/DEAH box helicase [Saprospiraceae bacterium]|nr:DEAD/DEAH box helicase [Saprospiraceae bacterium]
MNTFETLNLSKQLQNAIDDLGFNKPTPIQNEAYPVILSGKDMVGIAQTGTGKTLAYLLPILKDLKFSKQVNPRVLILVPTRELVLQLVENINSLTKYMSVRALGVYGGTNINTQKQAVAQGCDILVATPGRLYDLAVTGVLQLNGIKKLVIDEVDIMLDLGFRPQLTNIFDLLKERRQNIMFSATMTEEVDELIDDFFIVPVKISIAISGTPLDNIEQKCYPVQNFHTKVNLLSHLLENKNEFNKVLVFVSSKKHADKLFEEIEEKYGTESCIIHSNKSQNYRIRSIEQFDKGINRILVTTDIMARGLDLEKISHVINFDTPFFPENYIHRIGRTGRAEQAGKTILFYTQKEEEAKKRIEKLMDFKIPVIDFPSEVEKSKELIAEELPVILEIRSPYRKINKDKGDAFHEKSEKNLKTNQGGSYLRKAKKYKKPQTRGDKKANLRNRKK